MTYSTDLWDDYSDNVLKLRKATRLLRGGLQQATKNMPQGHILTIPLTESIGFQTLSHVIVHFQNAEPDLGRKGFQPEHTRLAERLSSSAVLAFKKYYSQLLRTKTGAPAQLMKEIRLDKWIDDQKEFERAYPIRITGKGLFAPTEELPIRSKPQQEQDVVALFNQMLSSGLIRGIQLLSSSQHNQYDGLFRIMMDKPFDKFIRNSHNPLGIDAQHFAGHNEAIRSTVKVLEYKYSIDALIEEYQTGEKNPDDISLAVAWEMGERWKGNYTVRSYLDDDNVHHREFHGWTHGFYNAVTGNPTFYGIILNDLVNYCIDPKSESDRQKELYGVDQD